MEKLGRNVLRPCGFVRNPCYCKSDLAAPSLDITSCMAVVIATTLALARQLFRTKMPVEFRLNASTVKVVVLAKVKRHDRWIVRPCRSKTLNPVPLLAATVVAAMNDVVT